jgi:hypothetical protein
VPGAVWQTILKLFYKSANSIPARVSYGWQPWCWSNWEMTKKSDEYVKKNAQTIEFRLPVWPDEERTVDYSVHYSW